MNHNALNRRNMLGLLGLGSTSLALPGCARNLAVSSAAPSAADALDAIAWRLLEFSPESATTLGIDNGLHAGLRARLGDRSPGGMARLADLLKQDLALVGTISSQSVDAATRTSLDVVKSAYRVALDGLALPYGDIAVGGWRNAPYVVIQNVGTYLDVPRFLDADHQVKTGSDAETYLSRLGDMAGQLEGELARMAEAGRQGLIPPAFLLDRTIAQMRQSITDAQNGGGDLVASLVRRTVAIPGEWQRRSADIVRTRILPGYERQLAELVRQRASATMDPGLSARPHGDAFYAWALRASITTARTPAEVHALGHEQVATLHARMDPLLRALGYTQGTVGERMVAMGQDPRFAFAPTDAGRAEIVEMMRSKIDFIRTRLPMAFRRLVPGNLEIRRLPLSEEAGAPRAYGGAGSVDGKIPGKIWLNLGDTSRHSRFSLPTLGFHEGIPGHVWQGEYANRLPLIRSVLSFNAYSEGWALYAEQLADELGAYESDPAGQLGFLQNQVWRAARMVADTAIHAMGWSRAKTVDWFIGATGLPASEVSAEVDRYCSWPGQACGYKMGHSEIIRQRDRAQAALGAQYDLRDFNQAVVDGGNVPLDVLAGNIDRYVNAMKA